MYSEQRCEWIGGNARGRGTPEGPALLPNVATSYQTTTQRDCSSSGTRVPKCWGATKPAGTTARRPPPGTAKASGPSAPSGSSGGADPLAAHGAGHRDRADLGQRP